MIRSARDPRPEAVIIAASRDTTSCTALQARLAMLSTPYGGGTLLAAVEYLVNESGDLALIASWDHATVWYRNSPVIAQLGGALGLSDDQIDALFQTALSL